MAGRKGKGKSKKIGNTVNPLLAVTDFSDFLQVDCGNSVQDGPTEEELDSDTEDAIYAQMYFNSSDDVAFTNLFNKDCKPLLPEIKNGGGLGDGVSDGANALDGRLGLHSSSEHPSGGDQSDVPLRISYAESASSHSAGEEVLEFSFRKNGMADPQQKKRKRKKKKDKASRISTDDDQTAVSQSSSPLRSSPGADIRNLFDSSKKASKRGSKSGKPNHSTRISPDDDDKSSLELGEISTSSNSSPTRGAGSADMDISSVGGEEDDENVSDPWKISEKDKLGRDAYNRLYGHDDNAGRYYGSQSGKCRNCKQRGHVISKCPWPKRPTVCYLCASVGHLSGNCPQGLCTYCYRKKHRGRPCSVHWASPTTECMRCHMFGHHASICPDQWRQYHHTLYEHSNIMDSGAGRMRADKRNIYCSNCSKKGHFGFECSVPGARWTPKHHFPLIARHDMHMWPPRDGYSICIIRSTLQTRQLPPTGTLVDSPQEVHSRKRGCEEAGGSADHSRDAPQPPSKKRRKRKKKSNQNKLTRSDSALSNDMESISSDDLDDDKPLIIAVPGANGERKVTRERLHRSPTRPQSLLGSYHQPIIIGADQQHNPYSSSVNRSFSASPFINMNSQVSLPGSSSPYLNTPPFPRTPHSFHDSEPRHQQQRRSFDFDRHPTSSRRDSTGMYSADESQLWNEEPRDKRLLPPMPPPLTPPLPPLPHHTPPLMSDPAGPSRAYSTGFRQPHPPQYHRRHSEPASNLNLPGYKSSTPTSRQDYRSEEYMTSERGFRMSGQRAMEIGYNRYGPRDSSQDSGRRNSSGYGRY